MSDREGRTNDDEALSALLDGALPAEEALGLERRLGEEPALARRLEELRQVDEAVRETYAGIADEPMPQGVVALLRPRPVLRLRPRASAGTRWFGLPVAAGVGLAAGFLIALLVLPRAGPLGPPGLLAEGGVVEEGSALHEVLEKVPSGEARALAARWSATPRLTFRSTEGHPCRRVDLTGAAGNLETLVCRRGGAWRVELVGFGPPGTPTRDGLYRPAAGSPSRIDVAIDALIEGAPLGREAERAWISRGWQDAAGR